MKEPTASNLTHRLFQVVQEVSHIRQKQYLLDGLTPGEQSLLMVLVMILDLTGRAPTVSEVSNRLQITPAGVTHLVNPLEESGHIERLQDPNDRRIVRVGLTATGRRAAETLMQGVQNQLGGLVQHLGEEDSKTLIRLLSKAVEFFSS